MIFQDLAPYAPPSYTTLSFALRRLLEGIAKSREPQCKHQPPNELPATIIPHRRYPIVFPQNGQAINTETTEVTKAQINNMGAGLGIPIIKKTKAAMNDTQKSILTRL